METSQNSLDDPLHQMISKFETKPESDPPLAADILGVPIHSVTMEETVRRIIDMIRSGRPHHVMTVNPEFVMLAQRNIDFMALLQTTDLNIPDGIGSVWAGRLLGWPMPERVTGVDLVERLANAGRDGSIRAYFLGAAPGVSEQAAAILMKRNPGFIVVGTYAGSHMPSEEDEICKRIESARPNLLLVAFGAPRQDLWVARTQSRLQIPVAIGVGGTFDFITGRSRRAPRWTQQFGVEWLHRLMKEPFRWRRMLALPQFASRVLVRRFLARGFRA